MSQNQNLQGVDYKSDNVQVSVQRLPGSQVRLEITVSPQATEASYKQAVKAVNKEISLPGFRKGKAPDEVVIKKYPQPIKDQWRDIVLQLGFKEALRLTNLQPFNSNTIRCTEYKEHILSEPAKFVVMFEAGPNVPHVDIQDITLPRVDVVPIKQSDVDQVLKNLRLYHSKWEDVTDRSIEEGDFIDLDIENLDDAITICKDTRFEVQKGIMANWMRKLLVGANLNESVEGVSEKETPSQQNLDEEPEEEFRQTRCRMTIKSIKKPIMPDLNEEFAKKTGTKDIAELEERVKADLERRANDKRQQQLTKTLDEELLAKYQFDVPKSLVEQEVGQRLTAQREWMISQNAPAQEMDSVMKELEQRLPSDVEKGCRLLFLLLGFAEQQNISVSQEEIIGELAQQVSYGQAALGDMKDPNVVQARITQGLLLRKAKNYIVEQVLQRDSE